MIVKSLLNYIFRWTSVIKARSKKLGINFLLWSFWEKKNHLLWTLTKSLLPNNKSSVEKTELVGMISMKRSQYFLVWTLKKVLSVANFHCSQGHYCLVINCSKKNKYWLVISKNGSYLVLWALVWFLFRFTYHQPIVAQCSVSILPENVRKRKVFLLRLEMEYWPQMG